MRVGLFGVLAFALSFAGMDEPRAQMVVGGEGALAEAEEVVTINATVEVVDLEARLLTVVDEVGNTVVVTIGPEVTDIEKIKVKEKVALTYREAVALTIRKRAGAQKTEEQAFEESGTESMGLDAPTVAAQEAMELTPQGAKGYETKEISVTIKDINRAKRVVTFYGEGDSVRNVTVGQDVDLDNLEPGDRVVLLVTEAVAVSVKPIR